MQTQTLTVYPDGRMDPANAAQYLGLSIKTLAMKRTLGDGPRFCKVGGRVFYFQTDLDAWVAKSKGLVSTAQYQAQRAS